jgi:hypothetical protein
MKERSKKEKIRRRGGGGRQKLQEGQFHISPVRVGKMAWDTRPPKITTSEMAVHINK